MIRKIALTFLVLLLFSNTSFAKIKSVEEQKLEWNDWLEDLKEEMLDKGISKKTIDKAYKDDYFHEIKEVVLQDKIQAEFILTSDKYINKLITQNKVNLAREHYKNLTPKN